MIKTSSNTAVTDNNTNYSPKGAEFTVYTDAACTKIVTGAVDATGAGDNFVAGFASELLRGKTNEEALKFANACGAICTTAVGAGTALRSQEQVLQFLEEKG